MMQILRVLHRSRLFEQKLQHFRIHLGLSSSKLIQRLRLSRSDIEDGSILRLGVGQVWNQELNQSLSVFPSYEDTYDSCQSRLVIWQMQWPSEVNEPGLQHFDPLQSRLIIRVKKYRTVLCSICDIKNLLKVLSEDTECEAWSLIVLEGKHFDHGLSDSVFVHFIHQFHFLFFYIEIIFFDTIQ